MTWPDIVNGCFELFGGALLTLNIARVLRDRSVRGVSVVPTAFFSLWGMRNLFYYPSLGQWASFAGGIAVVTANTIWVALALYYKAKERKGGSQ